MNNDEATAVPYEDPLLYSLQNSYSSCLRPYRKRTDNESKIPHSTREPEVEELITSLFLSVD